MDSSCKRTSHNPSEFAAVQSQLEMSRQKQQKLRDETLALRGRLTINQKAYDRLQAHCSALEKTVSSQTQLPARTSRRCGEIRLAKECRKKVGTFFAPKNMCYLVTTSFPGWIAYLISARNLHLSWRTQKTSGRNSVGGAHTHTHTHTHTHCNVLKCYSKLKKLLMKENEEKNLLKSKMEVWK